MQFCIYISLKKEIEPKHMQAALIDSRTVSYCVRLSFQFVTMVFIFEQ